MTTTRSITPRPDDPQTIEEWQEAADAAEACLSLHAARRFGFIKGGPEIDADRCASILLLARERGVCPKPDAINVLLEEWTALAHDMKSRGLPRSARRGVKSATFALARRGAPTDTGR